MPDVGIVCKCKVTLLPVCMCDGNRLAKRILKLAIMSYSDVFKFLFHEPFFFFSNEEKKGVMFIAIYPVLLTLFLMGRKFCFGSALMRPHIFCLPLQIL